MFKSRIINIPLILAAIALPFSAVSKEINHDYVEGSYGFISDTSVPGMTIKADGFGVSGSHGIAQHVALTAGYQLTQYEEAFGLDVSNRTFQFGVTAHYPVTPKTDIYGNLSLLNTEVEVTDGIRTANDDETGYAITAGLRHLVNNHLELEINLTRQDVFESTVDVFNFGARFHATDAFSLGLGYGTTDDVSVVSLNARVNIK